MRIPYEYATIQACPRVERGELINVGVLLYCHRTDFLEAGILLVPERLLALDPAADVHAVRTALGAWVAACAGGGQAHGMSLGERFRWMVAPRSTILRAGAVHMGLAADPSEELDRLVDKLVRVDGP
ncbi:DUF3037 domain-containing protein [Actinoplanes sp. NBRC 103695]|uniref:DUF3037 domain-containing protein n=1 Tax=Actinoplanes sp. NBRC 103695 TaxID=3032202 RepID=UPI0024A13E55|nr:DUF3037 domain-containing protein [Actinoplanes sp. NBRC 103695]GLY94863.1 hypothetical protein Acsp02_21180 [Actinoplanes sp. NBRC 103695]